MDRIDHGRVTSPDSDTRENATDGHRFAFDPADGDVLLRTSLALEALTGLSVGDLPPLAEFVDPDAVVSLFAAADERRTDLRLEFDYLGYTVVLDAAEGGRIVERRASE